MCSGSAGNVARASCGGRPSSELCYKLLGASIYSSYSSTSSPLHHKTKHSHQKDETDETKRFGGIEREREREKKKGDMWRARVALEP